MARELTHRISNIMVRTKLRVYARAGFYMRAGRDNYSVLSRRGQDLLIKWIEEKSQGLEERAEQVLWNLNRPIGWLSEFIADMECKMNTHQTTKESAVKETLLQDDEVSRMMDEGGPPSITEDDSEQAA